MGRGRTLDQFEIKSELRDYMSEHARGLPFWVKEAMESFMLSIDLGYPTMVYYNENQERIEKPMNVNTLIDLTSLHHSFDRYKDWLFEQRVKWKREN